MSDRYQIEAESKSGHCCFEYTVVDTDKPIGCSFETVCECFDRPDAELVAKALNEYRND